MAAFGSYVDEADQTPKQGSPEEEVLQQAWREIDKNPDHAISLIKGIDHLKIVKTSTNFERAFETINKILLYIQKNAKHRLAEILKVLPEILLSLSFQQVKAAEKEKENKDREYKSMIGIFSVALEAEQVGLFGLLKRVPKSHINSVMLELKKITPTIKQYRLYDSPEIKAALSDYLDFFFEDSDNELSNEGKDRFITACWSLVTELQDGMLDLLRTYENQLKTILPPQNFAELQEKWQGIKPYKPEDKRKKLEELLVEVEKNIQPTVPKDVQMQRSLVSRTITLVQLLNRTPHSWQYSFRAIKVFIALNMFDEANKKLLAYFNGEPKPNLEQLYEIYCLLMLKIKDLPEHLKALPHQVKIHILKFDPNFVFDRATSQLESKVNAPMNDAIQGFRREIEALNKEKPAFGVILGMLKTLLGYIKRNQLDFNHEFRALVRSYLLLLVHFKKDEIVKSELNQLFMDMPPGLSSVILFFYDSFEFTKETLTILFNKLRQNMDEIAHFQDEKPSWLCERIIFLQEIRRELTERSKPESARQSTHVKGLVAWVDDNMENIFRLYDSFFALFKTFVSPELLPQLLNLLNSYLSSIETNGIDKLEDWELLLLKTQLLAINRTQKPVGNLRKIIERIFKDCNVRINKRFTSNFRLESTEPDYVILQHFLEIAKKYAIAGKLVIAKKMILCTAEDERRTSDENSANKTMERFESVYFRAIAPSFADKLELFTLHKEEVRNLLFPPSKPLNSQEQKINASITKALELIDQKTSPREVLDTVLRLRTDIFGSKATVLLTPLHKLETHFLNACLTNNDSRSLQTYFRHRSAMLTADRERVLSTTQDLKYFQGQVNSAMARWPEIREFKTYLAEIEKALAAKTNHGGASHPHPAGVSTTLATMSSAPPQPVPTDVKDAPKPQDRRPPEPRH